MDKARDASMDITDRLLDVTDRDRISDSIEEINNLREIVNQQNNIIKQQVADITKLCNRVEYLENVLADQSWSREYERQYYESKPQESW